MNDKTIPELIDESKDVDGLLLDKFENDAAGLILHCALGALADQLEKAGMLDKREWLIESISRRRELLNEDQES